LVNSKHNTKIIGGEKISRQFFLQKVDDKQRHTLQTKRGYHGHMASVILVKKRKGKNKKEQQYATRQCPLIQFANCPTTPHRGGFLLYNTFVFN